MSVVLSLGAASQLNSDSMFAPLADGVCPQRACGKGVCVCVCGTRTASQEEEILRVNGCLFFLTWLERKRAGLCVCGCAFTVVRGWL